MQGKEGDLDNGNLELEHEPLACVVLHSSPSRCHILRWIVDMSGLWQILLRAFGVGDETLIGLSPPRVMPADFLVLDVFSILTTESSPKRYSSLMPTCHTTAPLLLKAWTRLFDPFKIDARCMSAGESSFDDSVLNAELVQDSDDVMSDEFRGFTTGCRSREQPFQASRLGNLSSLGVRNSWRTQSIGTDSHVCISLFGDVSLSIPSLFVSSPSGLDALLSRMSE